MEPTEDELHDALDYWKRLAERNNQMRIDAEDGMVALSLEVEDSQEIVEFVHKHRDDIVASIRFSALHYERSQRPGVAEDLEAIADQLEDLLIDEASDG